MHDAQCRQALADFLRTRRTRLAPAEVGLPAGSRRRTPGLRREELAQLAHIGTSWYTALEQGRDVQPSAEVLESLAQALRLTPVEREHLFHLAGQNAPARPTPAAEQVSAPLARVVEVFDPHPAYVIGRRWDVLAWNRGAELVHAFSTTPPPYPHNMVWRWFTNPAAVWDDPHWQEVAQSVVAQFRADWARYPGDPWFDELIADLQQASSHFRLWWPRHDVRGNLDRHKEVDHPTLGRLEFDHVTLQVPANPDLKLFLYAAAPATAAKLAGLLG